VQAARGKGNNNQPVQCVSKQAAESKKLHKHWLSIGQAAGENNNNNQPVFENEEKSKCASRGNKLQ